MPFCAPALAAEVAEKLSLLENLTASAGVPNSITPVWPDGMIQAPLSSASPFEKRAWVGGVPTTKKLLGASKLNVSVTVTGGGGDSTEGPCPRSAEPLLPLPQPESSAAARRTGTENFNRSRKERDMEPLLVIRRNTV